MSNYENQEEECKCIVCNLVEEFRDLLKDNVDWESALRHVLGVMASQVNEADEELADLVDEHYKLGFSEGILFGITQAQETMDNFVVEVTDRVYDIRDKLENPKDYADENQTEKLEDLSDEQYDEIQENIRKSL